MLSILRTYEKHLAMTFGVMVLLFICLMTTDDFFAWAFQRHQNILSWYIRPLFLIPFCYFSYKKNLAGISISIFALLTSMFWFPIPEEVDDNVKKFLQFEQDYLTNNWDLTKVFVSLTVPLSLLLLSLSFWKKSLWIGLIVIVSIAAGKIIWSLYYTNQAGESIIIPAVIGLVLCVGVILLVIFRTNRE